MKPGNLIIKVPNPAATQDEELICYAHRFFAMCGFFIFRQLKNILLRFGQIFGTDFAPEKSRNTPSIPEFSRLNSRPNL